MAKWAHNPGSKEAGNEGCTCATMDNCYGKGRGQDGEQFGWWISGNCPLHGSKPLVDAEHRPEGEREPE